MEEIIEGVYRLGSRWVNFYLVAEGDALAFVDSGFPGYVPLATAALENLGRKPTDVKAIVLTHTHSDHIGGAQALSEESGAPILVHKGEAADATGDARPANPKGFLPNMWRPRMLRFTGHAIANKGMAHVTVPEVTPFEDDEVLDVPGKLRVVHCPGHSVGHSALLLEDKRILFCGDAMGTLALNTGETGAMVLPFNVDRASAIRSLDVLEKVDADILLPGHGNPGRGRMSELVAQARRRA